MNVNVVYLSCRRWIWLYLIISSRSHGVNSEREKLLALQMAIASHRDAKRPAISAYLIPVPPPEIYIGNKSGGGERLSRLVCRPNVNQYVL